MTKSVSYYRVQKLFFIVQFPVVLILGNLQLLVFNQNFYYYLYDKSDSYANFNRENIVENATENLLNYFRGNNKLDNKFYSKQASFHLKDVKNLLQFSRRLFILSTSYVLFTFFFFLIKKRFKDLASSFLLGSVFTFLLVALLSLGLLTAFDWLFIKFHLLAFSNDLWLFEESDNLIKLFPQVFFINFANQLAVNILVSCALIAFISYFFKIMKLKS